MWRTHASCRAAGLFAVLAMVLLSISVSSACGEQCPTPEQSEYFRELGDALGTFGTANDEMGAIVDELADPEKVHDEDWRRRLRQSLTRVDISADRLANLQAPPGTELVQTFAGMAVASIREATDLYWAAVQQADDELEDLAAATSLNEGAIHMESVFAAAENFCN